MTRGGSNPSVVSGLRNARRLVGGEGFKEEKQKAHRRNRRRVKQKLHSGDYEAAMRDKRVLTAWDLC